MEDASATAMITLADQGATKIFLKVHTICILIIIETEIITMADILDNTSLGEYGILGE